jgi:hypothetical protein
MAAAKIDASASSSAVKEPSKIKPSPRTPALSVVCVIVDSNGDPDVRGTPLVFRYQRPVDWFPVDPPKTYVDINGKTQNYTGPVFDKNFVWYVYEIPSAPDPVDAHVPIFKVCCLRTYTDKNSGLTGKLAILWSDQWNADGASAAKPTAASALLAQFVAAGKMVVLDAGVLTANEAMIQIA